MVYVIGVQERHLSVPVNDLHRTSRASPARPGWPRPAWPDRPARPGPGGSDSSSGSAQPGRAGPASSSGSAQPGRLGQLERLGPARPARPACHQLGLNSYSGWARLTVHPPLSPSSPPPPPPATSHNASHRSITCHDHDALPRLARPAHIIFAAPRRGGGDAGRRRVTHTFTPHTTPSPAFCGRTNHS